MLWELFRFNFFALILFVGLPVGHSSIIRDSNEMTPTENRSEFSPEIPSESFPLNAIQGQGSSPIRTEPPTLQSPAAWPALRDKILSDSSNRISPEFKIHEGLRQRTAFWFDIYTRYGEAHHIVHHVLYPWIVFKVVDTTDLLQNSKGPKWLRRDRSQKLGRATTKNIRAALYRLAKRKSYAKLPALEQELFETLKAVPGPRRKVILTAARNVRSQLGQRDFFERGLINSSKYIPYMEEEFKRLGLPTELTRMPFVESSFNEDARSKVGASGIWQIMPRTGKAYMIVSDNIDERNNPIKATAAAGRLLRSYYRAMKSWPLTITSYNHGIGNIQTAIKRARSRELHEIIERYHGGHFKFASSNFYTCFLAALYAEKYNELLFKDTPREPLQRIETLKLAGKTRVRYLEKITGLPSAELLRYNLDLRLAIRRNAYLPRGFNLHLPPGYKDRVLRQIGTQDTRRRPRT